MCAMAAFALLGIDVQAHTGVVVLILALFVTLVVSWSGHWRLNRIGSNGPRAAYLPDDTHRVWCVGSRAAHARWQSMGPIEDVPFEPEVFGAPFALRAGWRMLVAWVAAAAAVYGAFYVFMIMLGAPLRVWFDLYLFYGSIAAGAFMVAAVRPTSVRIVPGRIDIMRGWFFQTSRPVVRSIPLRDRRVVMDLRSGIVFATDPKTNDQADAAVAFGTPRHKARIAHAVLRAAISTAVPPPLPDDAPVG